MTRRIIHRIFAVSLLLLISSPALAGARLDALAGDGLLLADADADHLWPAALADHAPALALRGWLATGAENVRPHDGSWGPDVRLALAGGGRVRGFWRTHAGMGPAGVDMGVQGAWRWESVALGVGWNETRLEADDSGNRRRSCLDVGLRLAADRAVIDLAVSVGSYTEEGFGRSDGTLRFRTHLALTGAVTAVALAEDSHGPGWTLPGWEIAGGLLFWPDADLQILVSWREQDHQVHFWSTEYLAETPSELRVWATGSRGPHIAFELRPSAWWSCRAGARVLWPREGETRSPSTRLGVGGTVHAGDWDLVAGWSRHESTPAQGLYPSDLPDVRLRLDVIRFF